MVLKKFTQCKGEPLFCQGTFINNLVYKGLKQAQGCCGIYVGSDSRVVRQWFQDHPYMSNEPGSSMQYFTSRFTAVIPQLLQTRMQLTKHYMGKHGAFNRPLMSQIKRTCHLPMLHIGDLFFLLVIEIKLNGDKKKKV